MTSRAIILTFCWISLILYWTGTAFTNGLVPIAAAIAFLLLEFTGFFNREIAVHKQRKKNRQHEKIAEELFRDAEEEYSENDNLIALIKMSDENGNTSSIGIDKHGELIITGDPELSIVKAATGITPEIIELGPEAVITEIHNRLAAETSDEQDND